MRAVLELDDRRRFTGKTIDLSRNGVGLLVPQALGRGDTGYVNFSIFVNGALEQVRTKVEVSNCVFLSTDVRVGFRFVDLDERSKKVLAMFLR